MSNHSLSFALTSGKVNLALIPARPARGIEKMLQSGQVRPLLVAPTAYVATIKSGFIACTVVGYDPAHDKAALLFEGETIPIIRPGCRVFDNPEGGSYRTMNGIGKSWKSKAIRYTVTFSDDMEAPPQF